MNNRYFVNVDEGFGWSSSNHRTFVKHIKIRLLGVIRLIIGV